MGVDAIAGRGDALTSAAGTAAGSRQFRAVAKEEATVLAAGRFENESFLSIPRDGLHDVREVVFHLSLRNPEELGELVGGQTGAGQESDQALAHCL